MKFKLSFKLHSDKIIDGSRYILDFPGLINIKTEDECLACKLLCKDNTIFKYLPKDVIIEGWNNVELIGDGEGIYLIINEHHFTLLKPLEITDTIASAFTTSNYWTLPGDFRSTNNATYTARFNSGSLPQSGKSSNILHAETLFSLQIVSDGYMRLWNWESGETEHDFDITSNTDYIMTVYLNGINRTYTLLNENTGVVQTHSFTDTAGQAHPSANDYIVIGNHTEVTQSWAGPFLGDIYLKEFTINIDGTEVFNDQMILDNKFNIYSNFSYYNYLTIPSTSLNLNNNDDVTYIIKFKAPDSTYSVMQQLFDFGDSYQLYFSSSSFNVTFWNNYTQEDISVFTASANTIYWVKFRRYQGTTYVSYSTDGTSYSEPITSYDPYVQSSTPSYGWIGRFRTSASDSRYYRGTIYMSDFKQIINGNTTIDGATATEGTQYSVTGSLNVINSIGVQRFGQGPTLSDYYSGESYPTIETGTLKLYQDWTTLKDIEAIRDIPPESDESDVDPQPTRVVSYTSTSANSTYLELTEVVPFNTADTWQVDLDITYNTTKNGETKITPHCFFGSSTTGSFNDTMDFLKEAMGPRSYLSDGYSLTGIGQINAYDSSYLVNGYRYILRLVFDGSSYKMYGKKQGESEFTQLGSTVYSSTKIASTATAWMFKAGYNDNYGCEDTLWCENSKIIINGQTWLDFSTAESEGKLINHGCTVVTE